MTTKEVQNRFNDLAANMGCNARIELNKNKTKFYEFRGSYEKGFEVWFPINGQRFAVLTNKYPQLQND